MPKKTSANKSKYDYNNQRMREKCKRFAVIINKDDPILDYAEKQGPFATYVKRLILEDMKRHSEDDIESLPLCIRQLLPRIAEATGGDLSAVRWTDCEVEDTMRRVLSLVPAFENVTLSSCSYHADTFRDFMSIRKWMNMAPVAVFAHADPEIKTVKFVALYKEGAFIMWDAFVCIDEDTDIETTASEVTHLFDFSSFPDVTGTASDALRTMERMF